MTKLAEFEIIALIGVHADMLADMAARGEDKKEMNAVIARIRELIEMLPEDKGVSLQ